MRECCFGSISKENFTTVGQETCKNIVGFWGFSCNLTTFFALLAQLYSKFL